MAVPVMQIQISKRSEVPIREQLRDQIVFLIVTEKLEPGVVLPSVRELARRLKIHHNTVSHVYADLVRRTWLARRGNRLVVRAPDEFARLKRAEDLDHLINAVIRVAREGGHSLQALRERVRERLLAQPPDHLLVVEREAGLRRLLEEEVRRVMRWPVRGCCQEALSANRGIAIGALVVAPHYSIGDVDALLPKDRPAIGMAFSTADELVNSVRRLEEPSVIAVVSVSRVFLETARGLLAPALERRHTLSEYLVPLEKPSALRVADLVFCDSIAFEQVRHPRSVAYRLVASSSLEYVTTAMESYQKV
jgi:DNA-binding transcriptional regulator YhcF (GntR family)